MKIGLLEARNVRCFEHVSFEPGAGLSWLVGPNGAGKTTLLESAYILSRGRSFRAGGRAAPGRHGTREYLIHATLSRAQRTCTRLGLARKDGRWQARLDGTDLPALAPLFQACPVVWFGPGSETMVTGPAEERRIFLDWSVFHVEHGSLDLWRAWRRALRQRNALLRIETPAEAFYAWEQSLAQLAERIDVARRVCLASLEPYLAEEAALLVPELGDVRVEYRPGWDITLGLQQQLASERQRERERGFTQHGAHRVDWWLRFDRVAHKSHLSGGQAKAIALVCVLAQTRWLRDQIGEYPLLCLDDLDSELDRQHTDKVIAWLAGKPLQAWLTTTVAPSRSRLAGEAAVFHVEHSGVIRMPDRPVG